MDFAESSNVGNPLPTRPDFLSAADLVYSCVGRLPVAVVDPRMTEDHVRNGAVDGSGMGGDPGTQNEHVTQKDHEGQEDHEGKEDSERQDDHGVEEGFLLGSAQVRMFQVLYLRDNSVF
jgi:hypothetical protein